MTIPDEAVQAMPERIYAMPKSDTKHCVVAFDEASLDYHIEYVRADLAAPFLQGVKVYARQALDRFAEAAKNWGWQEDQGYNEGVIQEAKTEFDASYSALENLLSALEPSPRAQALEELPCDVQLPGVTLKRGVKFSVLLNALKRRESWPDADRALSSQPVADGCSSREAMRQEVVLMIERMYSDYTWHHQLIENVMALPASPGASDTRPAAPVEGLAPVLYMREDGVTITPSHFDSIISPKANYAPLVTRSQAEAILATERAEKLKWMEHAFAEKETLRTVEADNATLTARVKELHQRCVGWAKSFAEKCVEYEEQKRRAEAIEIQLAAAEKVREAAERVVWFDWSDNDDDAVKAVSDLRAALEDKP